MYISTPRVKSSNMNLKGETRINYYILVQAAKNLLTWSQLQVLFYIQQSQGGEQAYDDKGSQ